MPDIFDEVDEDLRADRAQAFLRRYGGVFIALMVLALLATAVFVWWQEQQHSQAEATAARFLAAQKLAEPRPHSPPPPQAATDFAAIAASGPAGYRVLARLQLAALEWQQNHHDRAIADWQAVSDDAAAPQLLRDYATLTSVQHQADSGDPAALKARILPVATGGSAWQPLAQQVVAMLDLRQGKVADARAVLKTVAADPQASQTLRQMAQSAESALPDDAPARK